MSIVGALGALFAAIARKLTIGTVAVWALSDLDKFATHFRDFLKLGVLARD